MPTCTGTNWCPSILSLGGIVVAASFINKNKLFWEVVLGYKDLVFIMVIFIALYCRSGYLWDMVVTVNTT
jgi:hypothetical protein